MIVMDVIMPVMDGIDACREITELLPGTRVLMLTASNEKDTIVRSIAAGATGYLQKYSGKEQLLTTLREVVRGEFRIPGDAARRLARAVRSPSTDEGSELLATLTERERDTEAVRRGGCPTRRSARSETTAPSPRATPCRGSRRSWASRPGSRWWSGRCAPAWWTAALLNPCLPRTGPEQVFPSLPYGRRLPADPVEPILGWDVHFEGLEDWGGPGIFGQVAR